MLNSEKQVKLSYFKKETISSVIIFVTREYGTRNNERHKH